LLIKKVSAELINQASRFLVLASAAVLPGWFWDFGASAGLGRIFVITIVFGLILLLVLLSTLWLGAPLTLRRPFLTKIGLILALTALLSSIFSLDPKVSFGLAALSSVPLGVVLIFAFLFFSFVINRPYSAAYLKKLLGSYLLGSTVLTAYIAVRFFFGGYEPLAWVGRDGWLIIFSLTIFLLTNFALSVRGAPKALWSAALIPHFLVLFLWDQAIPWIIVLLSASALLAFQSIYAKKLWRSNMVYPAQIWVAAALLLFLPIKVFTGATAPVVSSYSYQEISQAIAGERLQNLVFGVGPGNGAVALAARGVSFFDPDPVAGAALFASEIGLEGAPSEQALSAYTASAFPAESTLNNGYASILIEGGIVSALAWLALIIAFIIYVLRFFRTNWPAFKNPSADEIGLGAALGAASVLFLLSLAVAPWSFATALVLIFFLSLSVMFYKADVVSPLGSKVARRWEHLPPAVQEWSRRAGGILAIIIYLAVVVMSSRVVLAARQANAALSTDAPGVAENHWQAAGELNPWNDLYRAKREESRLLTLSDSTPLPEQKDIVESASLAFSKISRTSPNPIAHWLVARDYVSMENFVEGSLPLARESYLKAIELWPTNVALSTELARLYRYRLDSLVSTDRSASALNQEAQDRLKYALKLAPDYLPARLELAFLVEKLSGIPAAVAELEPWEDTNPEIRYHLGRLHFNDNKLDIAEEKFKQVLKDVPNHSNAHYSLGVVYFRNKEYDKSLKEFEKVLELNPGNEDVKAKIEEVKKKIK